MLLTQTGLDITLDEQTGELSFGSGVLCDGHSEKRLAAMEGLFESIEGEDGDQRVYWAYRNIRRPEDDAAWTARGLRYDITVLLPGAAHGELFKTSGHYHGFGPDTQLPYAEVYEVLAGEVAFVLQCDSRLSRDGQDSGKLDYVRVVRVREGESVIIPPYCGHGSINVAEGVSAFSNIAFAACPLFYGPVARRHGLAVRVLRDGDDICLRANELWGAQPEATTVRPQEAHSLGIDFGVPCYETYLAHPERYGYMTSPDGRAAELEALILSPAHEGGIS